MNYDMICKCGHDWNFHNVLDNEQCHEMDCTCEKFSLIKSKEKKNGENLSGSAETSKELNNNSVAETD
jgi:hypothetical protein